MALSLALPWIGSVSTLWVGLEYGLMIWRNMVQIPTFCIEDKVFTAKLEVLIFPYMRPDLQKPIVLLFREIPI